MQPINNKLINGTWIDNSIVSPTVKQQENLLQKKLNILQGLLSETSIADLRQASCSYSEIYKTLNAEEIPISQSAIKRIGQCFKKTGNVVRKKGSGRSQSLIMQG